MGFVDILTKHINHFKVTVKMIIIIITILIIIVIIMFSMSILKNLSVSSCSFYG